MTYQLLQGDCITVLKTLEAYSVSCVVTSPPYYGLRDYGTAAWVGGDPECDHQYQKGGRNPETSAKQISSAGTTFSQYEKVCKRCGAQRIDDQIGLEETPQQYVEKMVQVFREVRRVLKDDGTVWLNLGDSYAGGNQTGRNDNGRTQTGRDAGWAEYDIKRTRTKRTIGGEIKPKDLIGIPWMVAFALRADGWYLRSDIIWHKPNPMPESTTDRPTKAHEYIFLLTKSARYYYDADAIAEPIAQSTANDHRLGWYEAGRPERDYPGQASRGGGLLQPKHKNLQPDGQEPNTMHLKRANGEQDTEYPVRNKRSVWTVSTQPYKDAHFATFPPKLIEPCILAGSRPGDVVLDPFNGSGTTGAVAIKHHRNYIGIDLNPEYIALTRKRFAAVQPVLFGVHHGE